jgi:PAS domain S-box-containing protein
MKMTDIPLYNSRLIKNYIEYLDDLHPEIDTNSLLYYSGITTYQLEDGGHWFNQRQIDLFHEALGQQTKDPDIPQSVGRYVTLSKSASPMRQYTIGFVTPSAAYSVLGKLYPLFSRACTIQTKSLGSNQIEITVTPNPGVEEKSFQCGFRTGVFEAIAKPFTTKFATVEHPTCLHKEGECCRYIITWEKISSLIWKRIRNYIALSTLIIFPAFYFILPSTQWVVSVLLYMLFVMILFLYSEHVEKKELSISLKQQGDLANNLLEETNIRYNNVMLIHDIGQATSKILNTEELFNVVIEAIEKRLDFDRGMIMLSNREKTRLIYSAGYGYNPEHEKYLSGIEFHLDNPDSRGPIVEAYRKHIPVLVDNLSEIGSMLSKRSRSFAESIGAHSFICIPIFYEDESMGVLAVDNIHSKRRLSQTDVNLLMGIAPQIAISINNARSYQLIRESEEKFRSLSENAPDIIYTLDIDGSLTYVNPAWERVLGYKLEEVKGKYFIDFAKKKDAIKYIQIFKKIRDNKETVRDYIGTLLHKDGSERFFSMSGTPNLDTEGKTLGLIGVFKDITDRKQLEAQFLQAQKMEAVGTLAGGIAHDFNNLLMGIQGFTSLMLFNANDNHVHYEKLKRIEDLVKSGADLTRQLLGFARGGKYELKVTNLNEVIEKTANMFGRTQKEILIHQKYDKDLWATEVDRGQIEQVLLNLYVNAWQAMPGGGDLYLETSNVALDEDYAKSFSVRSGPYVKVSVRDTGIGMDERTQERVFEPFFTTKEMGRGTGLGLASAYGIVKSHNGIIHVHSEPGHGTTFSIYLPATEKEVMQEELVTEDILRGEETILLVDDENMIIDVSREILEQLGYKVLTAHSGGEAIEIFKEKGRKIDLLILDMIMPGLGLGETFDTLKTMNPDVRVILSSGYSLNDEAKKLMERGCSGFIQKPYSISDLSKKVREALHKK